MPKLADCGVPCMLVGYALNHEDIIYRLWNPNSSNLHITRGVAWLKCMYYQQKTGNTEIVTGLTMKVRERVELETSEEAEQLLDTAYIGNNDEAELGNTTIVLEEAKDVIKSRGFQSFTTKRYDREVALSPQYDMTTMSITCHQDNLHHIATMEYAPEDGCFDFEVAGVGAGIGGGFVHTWQLKAMKYEQAMATNDVGWAKLVKEEHQMMLDNKVQHPIKMQDVPRGATILTSTWACKLKSNGTKYAWINRRGMNRQVECTMIKPQFMYH
eukprot:10550537-Ditylum_brightwellii.AAC.1